MRISSASCALHNRLIMARVIPAQTQEEISTWEPRRKRIVETAIGLLPEGEVTDDEVREAIRKASFAVTMEDLRSYVASLLVVEARDAVLQQQQVAREKRGISPIGYEASPPAHPGAAVQDRPRTPEDQRHAGRFPLSWVVRHALRGTHP